MTLLKLVFFCISLLAFTASAQSLWDGKWLGSGLATSNPNQPNEKNRKCSQIGLQLQVKTNSLDWQNGFYNCEDLKAAYDPTIFQISNSTLLLKGRPVGAINADKIEISILDDEDGVLFHLILTHSKDFNKTGEIHYQEEWRKSETLLLKIRGTLLSKNYKLH